jgi:SAM-dependent MidA family methyltransferase
MAAFLSCAERWRADSFYAHQHAEDHFRTEPMRSDRVAQALAARIMTAVGPDQPLEVFDIGAGNGALLRGLAQHLPKETAFHGVDIRERPEDVPGEWHQQEARDIPPHSPHAMPILICHEFFDDVPCDLVEVDADGHPRLLVVDDEGDAVVGPLLNDPAAGADRHLIRDWIERWWPPARPFMRIEVGRERDALWREFTRQMFGGIAFAIDYGHLLSERLIGTWDAGTVIGWRHGRAVSPRWDGSRNVTAHVAMDALAHAGSARTSRIYRQRDALHMAPSPVLTTGESGDYLWLEADLRGAHHE